VTLDGDVLREWLHISYGIKPNGPNLDHTPSEFLFDMKHEHGILWPSPPAFYATTLELEAVEDTYLKLSQWGKVKFNKLSNVS